MTGLEIYYYFIAAFYTILPPIFIVGYIYRKDLYDKEPGKIIRKCFLYGILIALPVGFLEIFIEKTGVFAESIFLYSFFGVALIEEGGKLYALMKYPFKLKDFNEPYDGILYSATIGLGFAFIENILYVIGNLDMAREIAMGRMFTAIPAHAAFGVLMGYFVGLAKFDLKNKTRLVITGLVIATLTHCLYNYFIFKFSNSVYMLFTFVVLIIALYLSKIAIKKHQDNSPFKN